MTGTGAISPVTHGATTVSWSPEGGGTATETVEKPNVLLIGAGGIVGMGGMMALVMKGGTSPLKLVAGAGIAGAGLIAGSLLADRFKGSETRTASMTRDQFLASVAAREQTPTMSMTPFATIGSAGLTAAAGAMALAGPVLSKSSAPVPLKIAGFVASALGGLAGGVAGATFLVNRLTGD